jgi:hypothetical protein
MSLESEIASIPLRFDFYRYLAFKIISADLPSTIDPKDPFGMTVFTPQGQELINRFVSYALSVWNQIRPMQTTSFDETLSVLNDWWKSDAIQYQKEKVLAN